MKLNSQEINQIDTSRLLDFDSNIKLALYLAKRDKIDYVYNTSSLEGNAMTFPEVQTLLEGITIGGHKLSDEQQILNQSRSVEYLFKLLEEDKFKVDDEVFKKLNFYVAKEEALKWGEFRSRMIEFYNSDDINPSIEYLLDYYVIQNTKYIKSATNINF